MSLSYTPTPWRERDEQGDDLISYWRTFPAPSNEVAAADIIEQLERDLAATTSQRDDFKRQLTAEREGRMAAERIVDEVRARNRELEAITKERT